MDLPKIKNVFIIITSLLLIGISLFFAYFKTDFSYYGHLSAVFVELGLSITLIEVFFEYNKRKESFRVYSLARNYIFGSIYGHFNKILFKDIQETDLIENVGKKPSFHPSIRKDNLLRKLAKEIYSRLEDQDFEKLRQIIKKDFEDIERLYNLNIVYHNEDLFASISKFVDICYYIKNSDNSSGRNLRQKYVYLIRTWLYIINNFVYFSNCPLTTEIKEEFEEE